MDCDVPMTNAEPETHQMNTLHAETFPTHTHKSTNPPLIKDQKRTRKFRNRGKKFIQQTILLSVPTTLSAHKTVPVTPSSDSHKAVPPLSSSDSNKVVPVTPPVPEYPSVTEEWYCVQTDELVNTNDPLEKNALLSEIFHLEDRPSPFLNRHPDMHQFVRHQIELALPDCKNCNYFNTACYQCLSVHYRCWILTQLEGAKAPFKDSSRLAVTRETRDLMALFEKASVSDLFGKQFYVRHTLYYGVSNSFELFTEYGIQETLSLGQASPMSPNKASPLSTTTASPATSSTSTNQVSPLSALMNTNPALSALVDIHSSGTTSSSPASSPVTSSPVSSNKGLALLVNPESPSEKLPFVTVSAFMLGYFYLFKQLILLRGRKISSPPWPVLYNTKK